MAVVLLITLNSLRSLEGGAAKAESLTCHEAQFTHDYGLNSNTHDGTRRLMVLDV